MLIRSKLAKPRDRVYQNHLMQGAGPARQKQVLNSAPDIMASNRVVTPGQIFKELSPIDDDCTVLFHTADPWFVLARPTGILY